MSFVGLYICYRLIYEPTKFRRLIFKLTTLFNANCRYSGEVDAKKDHSLQTKVQQTEKLFVVLFFLKIGLIIWN